MNRQAYAPTPHSYVPNSSFSATINLDEEVKPTETRAERDLQESLAEVFSIIVTLDELEKAYLKDAIPAAAYKEICERSLKQYNALTADETVKRAFGSLEQFKDEWDLKVPRATERIRICMPDTDVRPLGPMSTPSHLTANPYGLSSPSSSKAPNQAPRINGVWIADATQDFITFLDAIKLGWKAKDQLHPLLTDVIQSVNKVTSQDFEKRGKIVQWLITLNQMKAAEELTEEQARELDLDITAAYNGFKNSLS